MGVFGGGGATAERLGDARPLLGPGNGLGRPENDRRRLVMASHGVGSGRQAAQDDGDVTRVDRGRTPE